MVWTNTNNKEETNIKHNADKGRQCCIPHTWLPRNRLISESKNLMILSHWLLGSCWGTLPGDLDDFPACTLAALGALQVITKKHIRCN
jgi:hypothetical protein